jgi:copper(I)-binding protein
MLLAAMLVGTTMALGGCGETPQAAQEQENTIQGMKISNARMVLAPVAGNPAAVYFDLAYDGERKVALNRAEVKGAKSAMFHAYGEFDRQVQMMEMLPQPLKKGDKLEFKPGDKHLMAMDPDASLKPGGKTEATIIVSGGKRILSRSRSAPPGTSAERKPRDREPRGRHCPVGGERRLTDGEVALARSVFGTAIDYAKVTIRRRKFFPFQSRAITMAPARALAFSSARAGLLRRLRAAPARSRKALHPRDDPCLADAVPRGMVPDPPPSPFCRYDYSLKPGWSLERYGIEQQAQIVKHAFWLRNRVQIAGVSDPLAYELLVRFPGATGPAA